MCPKRRCEARNELGEDSAEIELSRSRTPVDFAALAVEVEKEEASPSSSSPRRISHSPMLLVLLWLLPAAALAHWM